MLDVKRSTISLLGGLAVLFFPARAEMGRIHYNNVTLDHLVQMSSHIVVAQAVEAPSEPKKLKLGPKIRPYAYTLARYRVIEHLRPAKKATDGEALTITSFDADQFRGHVEYYARGRSRSPIVTAYQPSSALDPKAPMILFLKRYVYLRYAKATRKLSGRTDTFKAVAAGAIEHPSKKAAILAMMRKSKAVVVGPVAHPAEGTAISGNASGGVRDALEIVVGVCRKSDAFDDKIGRLLVKQFPGKTSLDWTTVEICPRRLPGSPR